jgi:hypothetical protein
MKPILIPGNVHQDQRGCLTFNNVVNLHGVKRIYTIENNDLNFIRGWQGHKIEQRWLIAMKGSFEIEVLNINFFEENLSEIEPTKFNLTSNKMDILHIPPGYLTSIKSLEVESKLLLMSDFMIGEIKDEIRYPL